jgi:Ca2+-transporting ATPase
MATGTDLPRRTRASRSLAHRERAAAERTTWRRWFTATTLGELVGFLIPVAVVSAGADELAGPLRFLLVVLAGAGEGAVLGWAQSRVLRPLLPGLSTRAWTARTAAAAALAWTIGMGPSSLGAVFDGWTPAVRVAVAVPAGLLLLVSIGAAQWTVLRRVLPGSGRWIGWTSAGWLAGLAVLLAVATPLWHPGQDVVLVAAIGALGGVAMAATMAAVTGWGLVRLLRSARLRPARPR